MSLFVEVWTRPGDANFGRVIDYLPSPYRTVHDGVNLVGDGSMQVANTFDRFDEILYVDPATPSSSVSSLVRVFDDADPTQPLFEWLPRLMFPTTDKDDPNVDISGRGIKSIWGYARVEAYDWDGSANWIPKFPDWIYGGANSLANAGFETSACQPKQYELHITATGGTYTISDGTDTTSAIAFDASDGTIEAEIEADIASIDDINVSPIPLNTGDTSAFLLEFVNPCVGVTLTVGTGSLTGGTATLTEVQAGLLLPSPWTKSQQISTGTPRLFGVYDTFELSTAQAHSGTQSLLIDPGAVTARVDAFAGTQQLVNVTEGGLYQASVWVYPTAAGQTYRLVIRGIDEDLIARSDVSPPANTWTQVTISDVTIPDGDSQVIFRFANTNLSGNPAAFYVDDAEFNEGQAAATVGKILGDLYDDATADHSAVRIVWEDDANPGSPYLTLDFTDTVDSNGDAWFHSDIQIRLWMRMTYLQVMEQFVTTYGYEWRIVPNNVETGTWLLQVYNPGGMKTDFTSGLVGIQSGSSDVRRSINRVLPDATDFLVEGEQRITTRIRQSGLDTALGLVETSRLDREAPTQQAVQDGAFEDATEALISGLFFVYELVEPDSVPLVAYQLGDLLHVSDPPEVELDCRFVDVQIVDTPQATRFEVQFIPATAEGS